MVRNISEKNQVLHLLLVTYADDLVRYLYLWARKSSSFICTMIQYYILFLQFVYLEPRQLFMMEIFFEK